MKVNKDLLPRFRRLCPVLVSGVLVLLLCAAPLRGSLSYVVTVSEPVVNTFEGEVDEEVAAPEEETPEEETPVVPTTPNTEEETPSAETDTPDTEDTTPDDGSENTSTTTQVSAKTGDSVGVLRYALGALACVFALGYIWSRKDTDGK